MSLLTTQLSPTMDNNCDSMIWSGFSAVDPSKDFSDAYKFCISASFTTDEHKLNPSYACTLTCVHGVTRNYSTMEGLTAHLTAMLDQLSVPESHHMKPAMRQAMASVFAAWTIDNIIHHDDNVSGTFKNELEVQPNRFIGFQLSVKYLA